MLSVRAVGISAMKPVQNVTWCARERQKNKSREEARVRAGRGEARPRAAPHSSVDDRGETGARP